MHVRSRNVRTSFSISQSVNDAHSKLMMAALTEETLVSGNNNDFKTQSWQRKIKETFDKTA